MFLILSYMFFFSMSHMECEGLTSRLDLDTQIGGVSGIPTTHGSFHVVKDGHKLAKYL